MLSQKEIIEKIRKDEFFIGANFNVDSLKRKFNNSLTIISEDLYSDEVHFVLELIQNADDNEYNSDENPFLKFIIKSDKILIQNNEKGFAEKNVLALCSVAESTKTKKDGYIGEKGIGFKSVFRISDEPHIFSNGFQFKFKRIDEELGLGYIVPYWIEEIPDLIDKEVTNILLPLNNEAKEDLLKFSEIEPELLLFLQKLHKVEIRNEVNNISRLYTKSEENGRIKLSNNDSIKYFKLVSHVLKVPHYIHEEKREIYETKIVLGFPLNHDGSAKSDLEQKVFAFLPTRSYGFKFMIQADFLVPSSRQDIHKDKKWNEWLRDNISTVFLESIEAFKKDINLKTTFYNYIPINPEISKDSIFLEVIDQLKTKLLNSNCALTESANWLKPSQVIRASEEIRSLISNEDLFDFFSKEYLLKEVENNTKFSILNFLEISLFNTKDLIEILKNTEWLEKQSDNWLIELYSYLENNLKNKTDINAIRKLKIVKLQSGKMESPDATIFFPLNKKQSYGFEENLPFIKGELLVAKEFLKYLGVSEPQPVDIIERYILKDFESTDKLCNWQSQTEEVRMGYINYIKDNLDKYKDEKEKSISSGKNLSQNADPLERLKRVIWIRYKTEDERWFRRPDALYLSKEYQTKNNLEFLFAGIEDIYFVHPQYIELSQKEIISEELNTEKRKAKLEQVKRDWKKFFNDIGVGNKPKIETKPVERNHYTSGYNHRRNTVKVFSSKLICSILDESNANKNTRLLKILDENWAYYKDYIKWNDCHFYYDWITDVKDSDWFVKITNSKWIPTKNGDLQQPAKLFLDKPEIRKILGDNVSYLAVDIKNKDFAKSLGVNFEVNVETVISALRVLINNKDKDKKRFNEIYSFLNENYKGNERQIKKYFQDENLIFIPEKPLAYVSAGKVIWNNVSDVFGNHRHYLGKYYPELKNFFVEKIGIKEKPLAKDQQFSV